MIRTLQLLIFPGQTWDRIVTRGHGAWSAICFSMLPLMLAGGLVDGYSLVTWGQKVGLFGHYSALPENLAWRYEAARISFHLIALFFSAFLLFLAARGFNFAVSYGKCLLMLSYGFCAVALGWFFDAIPPLNSWIGWSFGMVLAVSILYHGVALVLKPDQTKGFGLYLMSVMVLLASSGLAQYAALFFLMREQAGG